MGKKHYPQSFKDEAVLFYELGHSFAETQAKYGMAESTFFTWKQKFDKAHPVHEAITTSRVTSHKSKRHLEKLALELEVLRQCPCGSNASIDEKVAAVNALCGRYSIHVLCDALSLPRAYFKNLLARQFDQPQPNLIWVSDITYIKVLDQYYYICVVLDLFSRRILSYSISDSINTTLTLAAFDDAFQSRNSPQGLMFHSDQGAQYTSYIFRAHLRELHIKQSFSTPGTPYDNSVCESFFHTLKKALYHHLYGLLDEADVLADFLDRSVLLLVELDLVLLKQVVAVRVDGDDQRAELLDLAAPQRFGHAQLVPVVLGNALYLGGGDNGAAGGEHAVDRAELLAGTLGVGAHAALAHDDADTGVLDELILELFHAHRGRGADGNHLVGVVLTGNGADNGAGVEDGLVADVVGQLTTALNQAAVRHVAAGHEIAVEINDVTDFNVSQILGADRRDQNLFTVSDFYHYSCTPE